MNKMLKYNAKFILIKYFISINLALYFNILYKLRLNNIFSTKYIIQT
jgi:hypothetical protein